MKKLLLSSLLVFALMPSFSSQAQDDSCSMVLSNGKRVNLGALCGQDSSPSTRPQQNVTPVRRTSQERNSNSCPSDQFLYKPTGTCHTTCRTGSYFTLAGATCRPISNLIQRILNHDISGSELVNIRDNMTPKERREVQEALKIEEFDQTNNR